MECTHNAISQIIDNCDVHVIRALHTFLNDKLTINDNQKKLFPILVSILTNNSYQFPQMDVIVGSIYMPQSNAHFTFSNYFSYSNSSFKIYSNNLYFVNNRTYSPVTTSMRKMFGEKLPKISTSRSIYLDLSTCQ